MNRGRDFPQGPSGRSRALLDGDDARDASRRSRFRRFAAAAFKALQHTRTVLAKTDPPQDLARAVQLLTFALPDDDGSTLHPLVVAELRARCADVAAQAFRVADALAARTAPDAPPPRAAESPLDQDTALQGDPA